MPFFGWPMTSSATTTMCVDSTWSSWVTSTASNDATITLATWDAWNDTASTYVTTGHTFTNMVEWMPTPEESGRDDAKKKERAAALLMSLLTPEQRQDLETSRKFRLLLESNARRRLYEIQRGSHGNIVELDPVTEQPIAKYCVQPEGVPRDDMVAAQVLFLMHDEQEFHRKANRTVLRAA